MKRYPANHKVYDAKTGIRLKSQEHGYKLLPSFLYPTVIKCREERIAWLEQMVAEYPDLDFQRSLPAARAALTKAKKNYERALAWDKRRDEREAEGRFW